VENAIALDRYNRYPLVVDPSGVGSRFILKKMETRNITETSFLEDDLFVKNLTASVRFGTPLLVHDADQGVDPILNSLLDNEVRHIGGRCIVQLGVRNFSNCPVTQTYANSL